MSDFTVEPANTLLVGQVVASHLLLRVLGDGGMGTVYEGEHEILKERHAIKICKVHASTALKARAVNEAKTMSRLKHAGICQLHDVQWGPPDGTSPVMIMELLIGHTFLDELSSPVDWRRVAEVARDVLDALEYAHRQGVVHRDIKPENVFITDGKQVKVMDFGIAKLTGLSATRTGTQMGTPNYMSPEQCENAKKCDARADLYSVAAMMYRAVTGHFVFPRATAYEMISAHLNERPQPLRSLVPTVPDHLATVIHRNLAKAREQRHESAAEMRAILLQCLASGDGALKADSQMRTYVPVVDAPVPVAIESEETKRNAIGPIAAVPTVPGKSGKVTAQLGESSQPAMSSTQREQIADERLFSFVGVRATRRARTLTAAAVTLALTVVGLIAWALARSYVPPSTPTMATPAPRAVEPAVVPAVALPQPKTASADEPPTQQPAPVAAKTVHKRQQTATKKKAPKEQAPKEQAAPGGVYTGVFD